MFNDTIKVVNIQFICQCIVEAFEGFHGGETFTLQLTILSNY